MGLFDQTDTAMALRGQQTPAEADRFFRDRAAAQEERIALAEVTAGPADLPRLVELTAAVRLNRAKFLAHLGRP